MNAAVCRDGIDILVSILKANGIKKIIVSPGATNAEIVSSMQKDGSFELYSCIDERSAAYMACGLAAASGEAVAISCTGSTASRDYLPGLTEAYYRKLPIIAITSSKSFVNDGNLVPQYIDRSVLPNDVVKLSVHLPVVQGETDARYCELQVNRAISELSREGGGPVHINIATRFSEKDRSVCCDARTIEYYNLWDEIPTVLEDDKRIIITIGAQKKCTDRLKESIDRFCEKYNAVVLVDHSSRYFGKYRVHPTLLLSQETDYSDKLIPDLIIHIGEQSGDYFTYNWLMGKAEVWRVSKDGRLKDTFQRLTRVYEGPEEVFFEKYSSYKKEKLDNLYYKQWLSTMSMLPDVPELPFSNVWIAKEMVKKIPDGSIVHLGVSNTMRSWTFFDFISDISVYANVGARGIDGAVSSLVGHSFVDKNKLCFGVFGDLTFFYDMNALGNRHIGNNLRILLINNGGGTEFNLYFHYAKRICSDVNRYIAASGHNGNKSEELVKHYVTDLGFDYLKADDKESFIRNLGVFLSQKPDGKSILFEVFTNHNDESEAVRIIRNL